MASYRAYFIDYKRRQISEARDIKAESDGNAINTAFGWLDGQTIEVWRGDEHIMTFRPPLTVV